MDNMDLELLLTKLRTYESSVEDRILNIYQWGSRVYGTNTPESDWDFVVIATKSYPYSQPNTLKAFEGKESEYNPEDYVGHYEIYDDGEVNVTFVEVTLFKCMIMSHRLEMLESLFLPPEYVWFKKVDIKFTFDSEVFRKAVSWEAVRTLHKAERKVQGGNVKKGKKELFHAIRYLVFALQIVYAGKIYNFKEANEWWIQIRDTSSEKWVDHKKFTTVFHKLRTEFCDACPAGEFHQKLTPILPSKIKEIKLPPPPPRPRKPSTVLKTVDTIRTIGLEEFCKQNIGMQAHRHSSYHNLVFLRHEARGLQPIYRNEDIIRECNGLVLDENDNWNVICLPYYKFYSFGVEYSTQIDWSSATAYEKLDGNLCVLFHYGDEWIVSSKNSIEGQNTLCSKSAGKSLQELFWEVWKALGYKLPTDTNLVYMFELLHPAHRYAIKYQKRMVLHGVRDTASLEELDAEPVAEANGWELVRKIGDKSLSLAGLVSEAKQMNPYFFEGYVVRDRFYNRISIKSPYYVSLTCLSLNCEAHDDGVAELMATKVTPKAMLDAVRHNDELELTCYFPRYTTLGLAMRQKYEAFVATLEKIMEDSKSLSPKDFAASIQELNYRTALHAMRKPPVITPREYPVVYIANMELIFSGTDIFQL